LPFEFVFKQTISENKCSISYDKENVIIKINDNTFSFSKRESEFENSLFFYKPKFINYVGKDTYIIKQFSKVNTV